MIPLIVKNILNLRGDRYFGILLLVIMISGCASDLQTKVAGNLNSLSKDQTVAILPIETSHAGQKEMAEMFRQGLYANLKQSKFNLLEKYIVDGLLKQNSLDDPSGFLAINPMQFGEILGADAIVFSRINKVERNYFIVHSSIELSVSIQMIDTRTGEVLWRAEQTEHDFSGIGKIPTGITTALFAPIQFVTNKFNLRKMTSKMVDKLTALVKKPESAGKDTQFDKPVIAKNASTDLKKIEELQQLKAEWEHALDLDTEIESEFISGETQQDGKKEMLALKNLPSSVVPETMKEIQNKMPLRAKVREVQAVDEEMVPLPTVSKNKAPIPLNTLKATLATSTGMEGRKKQPHKKVASSKKIKNDPERSGALYTVQVGAYKTKAYAHNLSKKLVKKGYNAFVTHNKIYRVRVDKFKNKKDASKLAQIIQEKEKLKNFVTTVKPS
jgi:cell division septation protein DedD